MRVEATESEHAAGWGGGVGGAASLPRLAQRGLRGLRLTDLGAHLQLAQPGNHHGPNAVLVPRDYVFELGGAQRLKLDPAVVA